MLHLQLIILSLEGDVLVNSESLLVIEGSNSIFDMDVAFTANYSFSGRRRPIDSELLLMTDFINLKIKSTQYFRCVYRDMMCVRVFIEVSAHTYINLYICTVFLKKKDYSILVQALRKEEENRATWAGVLRDIRATMQLVPKCKVQHVRREANQVAHNLTQWATRQQQCMVMRLNAPPCVHGILDKESPGWKYPEGPCNHDIS
jgi:hypothetical protein